MIIKTNLAKIQLTETELILKNLFFTKKIKTTNIRSFYITYNNELNILTYDNCFIKKKYPSLKRNDRDKLERFANELNKEDIIVGTDFYRFNLFFNTYWFIFIFTLSNSSIIIPIYFLTVLSLYIYAKISETFYIYDTNSSTISILKNKNIKDSISMDQCSYKKLVFYSMYYEYRYGNKKIYFNRNITYPTKYYYFLKPNKLLKEML